jgi:hypothetical protein
MTVEGKKDLVALVGDKSIQATLESMLRNRAKSLGIRLVGHEVRVAEDYDSGCHRQGPLLLRAQVNRYEHALIVHDRHGCGRERHSRQELEADLEQRLRDSGWEARAAAIVIDPELEAWVWAQSPHVARTLGWGGDFMSLRAWLEDKGHWMKGAAKPRDPKEAMRQVLRHSGVRQSSALFQSLASKVSLVHCEDASFAKLTTTLRAWFGVEEGNNP